MKHLNLLSISIVVVFSYAFVTLNLEDSNFHIDNLEEPECRTLQSAICNAHSTLYSDSIFLSSLEESFQPDQYLISDHIILVNDLGTIQDLWSSSIQFAVEHSGRLELVGFDLKNLESTLSNYGSISLVDCVFQEGKDLTRSIQNHGEFSISHGVFEGGSEGVVIREAVFKTGAYIIL